MALDDSVLPVARFHTGEVVVDPTDIDVAEALGFRTSHPGLACDVAIVGAGPAGLSAAVYAASEGPLRHGRRPERARVAGRHELANPQLPRLPARAERGELTNRATEQAWLFGAEFLLARRVEKLSPTDEGYALALSDGTDVRARAVVLATGVDWRRLGVPTVEAFLGAGVFYGAAGSEADAFRDEHVYVVGGGNSAGQAAVHLARHAGLVTILIRGQSLADLDVGLPDQRARRDRQRQHPRDHRGRRRLRGHPAGALVLRDRASGAERDRRCRRPVRDDRGSALHRLAARPRSSATTHGYILTGADVTSFPLERPPLFVETSSPGVFAVGDARHGATRRVAPSVGFGAIAISLVHQYLAELA